MRIPGESGREDQCLWATAPELLPMSKPTCQSQPETIHQRTTRKCQRLIFDFFFKKKHIVVNTDGDFQSTYGSRVGYPQFEGGFIVEVLQDIPDELPVLQINTIGLFVDELTVAQ